MPLLTIRVTPRASRNAIAGFRGDVLLVRVTAPPVDDAANAAVIELLADALALPRRAIRIAHGARHRQKTVAIDGLDAETIRRRLSGILA